jgi:hypothetical protein
VKKCQLGTVHITDLAAPYRLQATSSGRQTPGPLGTDRALNVGECAVTGRLVTRTVSSACSIHGFLDDRYAFWRQFAKFDFGSCNRARFRLTVRERAGAFGRRWPGAGLVVEQASRRACTRSSSGEHGPAEQIMVVAASTTAESSNDRKMFTCCARMAIDHQRISATKSLKGSCKLPVNSSRELSVSSSSARYSYHGP